MEKLTEVKNLETGNVIQGNGELHSEWAVIQCFRPFGVGDVYYTQFQNVDTGESLSRYLPEDRKFNVLY